MRVLQGCTLVNQEVLPLCSLDDRSGLGSLWPTLYLKFYHLWLQHAAAYMRNVINQHLKVQASCSAQRAASGHNSLQQRPAALLAGWFNILGQITITAGIDFAFTNQLAGMWVLSNGHILTQGQLLAVYTGAAPALDMPSNGAVS